MWEIKEVNVYENNFKANDWFFSFSCNDNFCSMFYGGRSRDTRRISKESYVKLSEGSSDFTKINLKDGYINLSTVNFQFCGNTKASAQAVVSYRG